MVKTARAPDATVRTLVAHETLAISSHDTHVGMDSLVLVVTGLPGFIRAPLPEE